MHSKKEKKNLRTREGSHGGRCNFRESSHNLAFAVLFVKKRCVEDGNGGLAHGFTRRLF